MAILTATAVPASEGSGGEVDAYDFLPKVAGDIACGMCGLVAEDLWVTLVDDLASNSPRGDRTRSDGASRTAREMLEQLCHPETPHMLEHLVDMYDIRPCDDKSADQPGCGAPQKHEWYIKRDVHSPPPPRAQKSLDADYQAALQEAVVAAFQDDTSLATALGAALGGKGTIDQQALNELLDTAADDEGLDSDEKEQLHAMLGEALAKRAAATAEPPPPPPPPRIKTPEERTWHLAAYKTVCGTYLRAIEVDFTEAIDAHITSQNVLEELAKPVDDRETGALGGRKGVIIEAGKAAVRSGACVEICTEGQRTKQKKRKKRKKPSKAKSKKEEL